MNKSTFLSGCFFAVLCSVNEQSFAKTNIWGLDNIHKISAESTAPYTVYISAFISHKNALGMKSKLEARGYNAKIKRENKHYIVYIGPFASLNALQSQSNVTHSVLRSNQHNLKNKNEGSNQCKDCQLDQSHWFVQAQGGVGFPQSTDQILVDNGSNFTPPANVDFYSVDPSDQGSVALTIGKQFATQSFIHHYTVSGRVHYLIPANVGNTIMQYSRLENLNYNYNWKLSTLALTADTKVNVFNFSRWLPYVNGGLGISLNKARGYSETALSDVTARVSPAYANHASSQFTYHVGAGLDYLYNQNWRLSAGYEFESFGAFSSGSGQTTWSGKSLSIGRYQTNSILLGITYLVN